jgi:hypothetical protein
MIGTNYMIQSIGVTPSSGVAAHTYLYLKSGFLQGQEII